MSVSSQPVHLCQCDRVCLCACIPSSVLLQRCLERDGGGSREKERERGDWERGEGERERLGRGTREGERERERELYHLVNARKTLVGSKVILGQYVRFPRTRRRRDVGINGRVDLNHVEMSFQKFQWRECRGVTAM